MCFRQEKCAAPCCKATHEIEINGKVVETNVVEGLNKPVFQKKKLLIFNKFSINKCIKKDNFL